jgi:oligopeptide/dipeptide ABC transporter ATP-binding protein
MKSEFDEPQVTILKMVDLSIDLDTAGGRISLVDHVTFDLPAGAALGIVGESGSGKSLTCRALLGLVKRKGLSPRGALALGTLAPIQLEEAPESFWRGIRGRVVALVPQDPASSLDPVVRIGDQVAECLPPNVPRDRRRAAVLELLESVGIPEPEVRAQQYPHELSGGMKQRVLVACAIAGEPDVVVADEPTTALDVLTQAQVLVLLRDVQRRRHMAMILVSHDLGVVSNASDLLVVMYAGRIVESGPTSEVLSAPAHPYTAGLLASIPTATDGEGLPSIPGVPPSPFTEVTGCRFQFRCPLVVDACRIVEPALEATYDGSRLARCIRWRDVSENVWKLRGSTDAEPAVVEVA